MLGRSSQFPIWLEYSGLPHYLNKEIRGGAWSVFKKLVEIDCDHNPTPDTFEISISQLSVFTGLDEKAIVRIVKGLRRKKLIAYFLPDHPDELALFQINVPLQTPAPPVKIKQQYAELFRPGNDFFRYVDEETGQEDKDPVLRQVIDLYFNCIGLKMNSFVLDELRLMRNRFPLDKIKRAFERARQNELTSLNWVVRQLFRESKKNGQAEKQK